MYQKKESKKLVLILATFTSITTVREEVFGNVETKETRETNKNIENNMNRDEDLGINLIQVFCI